MAEAHSRAEIFKFILVFLPFLRSTARAERRFKLKDYTGILRLCFFFASMTMMMMASFEHRTLAKAFKALLLSCS